MGKVKRQSGINPATNAVVASISMRLNRWLLQWMNRRVELSRFPCTWRMDSGSCAMGMSLVVVPFRMLHFLAEQ